MGAAPRRHIPLLRETEVGPLAVVQWSKKKLEGEPKLKDLLPLEIKAGEYLVLDVGQFAQAYSVLDFEADEGSRLALEYAQSFRDTDGLNRSISWGHVNQYTAKAGRQTYMSTDTFGCKYVVVQVVGGRVRLLGMKMVNRLYPFDVVGKFASSDPLLNDIWRMGVRTIQTCSEDAYVDCATRERVEWLGDVVMVSYPISRLTMAGPGVDGKPYWSDPRLFGNMLRHMGQSVQPDGRIKARHPSTGWDIHTYIEDYSCLWIQALRTWHDNTGDLELVREAWPAVTAQLKWFLDRRTERGLVKAREFVFPGNPLCYQVCEGATLNAFVVRALADAAELARLLGQPEQQRQYAEASQAIQKAINCASLGPAGRHVSRRDQGRVEDAAHGSRRGDMPVLRRCAAASGARVSSSGSWRTSTASIVSPIQFAFFSRSPGAHGFGRGRPEGARGDPQALGADVAIRDRNDLGRIRPGRELPRHGQHADALSQPPRAGRAGRWAGRQSPAGDRTSSGRPEAGRRDRGDRVRAGAGLLGSVGRERAAQIRNRDSRRRHGPRVGSTACGKCRIDDRRQGS